MHPDVQAFVHDVTLEVAQNYDVDSVEYSDRIPAMPVRAGYDAAARCRWSTGSARRTSSLWRAPVSSFYPHVQRSRFESIHIRSQARRRSTSTRSATKFLAKIWIQLSS